MLVLSRQKDEVIRIGDDIQIMVVAIGTDNVRIGVQAPRELPVHREEIYQLLRKGNQQKGEASQ